MSEENKKGTDLEALGKMSKEVPQEDRGKYDYTNTISAPKVDAKTATELVGTTDKLKPAINEATHEWYQSILAGDKFVYPDDYFINPLRNTDANWSNVLRKGDQEIKTGSPKFAINGGKASGELAIQRARRGAKLGTTVTFYLPHSGFWLTLRAPTSTDELDFNVKLMNEKASIGKSTGGRPFGYASAIVTEIAVEHALQLAVKDNLDPDLRDDMMSHIKVQDYPIILTKLKHASRPNGFVITQPCIADTAKCQHIDKRLYKLDETILIDSTRFSKAQLSILAKRTGKVTKEDLELYQKEFKRELDAEGEVSRQLIEDTVTLRIGDDNVTFELQTPDIASNAKHAREWLFSMEAGIMDSMSIEGKDREAYIQARANIQYMSQYASWFKSITIQSAVDDEEPFIIEDHSTIMELLGDYGTNEEANTKISELVQNYIERTTVGLIGIAVYNCSSCNTEHPGDVNGIIPLNALEVFTKLTDMQLREMYRT